MRNRKDINSITEKSINLKEFKEIIIEYILAQLNKEEFLKEIPN